MKSARKIPFAMLASRSARNANKSLAKFALKHAVNAHIKLCANSAKNKDIASVVVLLCANHAAHLEIFANSVLQILMLVVYALKCLLIL